MKTLIPTKPSMRPRQLSVPANLLRGFNQFSQSANAAAYRQIVSISLHVGWSHLDLRRLLGDRTRNRHIREEPSFGWWNRWVISGGACLAWSGDQSLGGLFRSRLFVLGLGIAYLRMPLYVAGCMGRWSRKFGFVYLLMFMLFWPLRALYFKGRVHYSYVS